MYPIIPPLRWTIVEPGLTRGAYPLLRNFRHLFRTRLKTVVSLVPEAPSADLVEFAKVAGIELVHIQVNRSSTLGHSLMLSLVQALNVCIDEQRHPIYLHCLDGRRIVGLVVLLLRRLQGWSLVSSLAEFWRCVPMTRQIRYSLSLRRSNAPFPVICVAHRSQTAMRSAMQPLEIEKMTRDLETFVGDFGEVTIPEQIPR